MKSLLLWFLSVGLALASTSHWPQFDKRQPSPIYSQKLHLPPTRQEPSPDELLPTHLVPSTYNVSLLPRFDEAAGFPVEGHVAIHVTCNSPANNVTMHAVDMTFREFQVYKEDTGEEVTVSGTEQDPERDLLIINLDGTLQTGTNYVIEIWFDYQLTVDLYGFYLGYYEQDGETHYLASAFSEPIGTRQAFPCFDEPALKATFTVTLGRQETWTSLSNMPLSGSSPIPGEPGMVWDTYETTVPMPTYLACFAVSEFESVSSDGDTPFAVWARRDLIELGEYVLTKVHGMVASFEELLGVEYSLPKMDLIALPQFAPGAMENWGLITYRESLLLGDRYINDANYLYAIDSVTSHELAHQWFGNLVTLDWWTYIWLNEGFATYFQYWGMLGPNPGWNLNELSIYRDFQGALIVDSTETTNPITLADWNDPSSSTIIYAKGSRILKMVELLLGFDFFAGLNTYLVDLTFGNAVNDDLWQHLQDATSADLGGHTVKEIMDTWTLQPGYPLITVTRDEVSGELTVSQRRFFSDPNVEPDSTLWIVPISVATPDSSDPQPVLFLSESVGSLTLDPMPGNEDFFLLNVDSFSFYRINYEPQNWMLLAQQLETDHSVIPANNRAQFIDDAFTFVSSGLLPDFTIPMSFTRYLGIETRFVPWATASYHLDYIFRMFKFTESYPLFQNYLLSLLEPLFPDTPFETLEDIPESYPDITDWFYADLIQSLACPMGIADCRDQAFTLFQQWKASYDTSDPDKIVLSPNVKATVYVEGLYVGDVDDWNFAYQHYQLTNYESERNLMLMAMAYFPDADILTNFLQDILSTSSPLRQEDGVRAFRYIAFNLDARQLSFDFLSQNWNSLKNRYGGMTPFVEAFVDFNTETDRTALLNLMNAHPEDANAFTSTLARVEVNLAWMERHFDFLVGWLGSNAL